MSTTLTRRSFLARTPAVVIPAMGAMAIPAVALARANDPDATLVALEAELQEAGRQLDGANDHYNSIGSSLPSWVWGDPIVPDDNPLFRGLLRAAARSREMIERGVLHKGYCHGTAEGPARIGLKRLNEFNDDQEAEHADWEDMTLEHPDREKTRKAWLKSRAEARRRIKWWESYHQRQETAKEESGINAADVACEQRAADCVQLRERIIETPAAGVLGMGIKLRALQTMVDKVLTNHDVLTVMPHLDKHWGERTGRVERLMASMSSDADRLTGGLTA